MASSRRITYWAWPPDGAGHAVRAASICRHLQHEVVVVRGTDDPRINRSLDHFGIPYVVHERKANAAKWVKENCASDFIVYDDYPNAPHGVDLMAGLYLWRMNRQLKLRRPTPTIAIEGHGAMWPLLMLEDHEILSRSDARDALGIPQDKFTIIGITSTARPGVVEATEPDLMLTPDEFWPALKYLRAADHIVGCPGANLWGEVAYLGIPVTWIRAPHAPDQAVRLFDKGKVPEPQRDVARRLAEIIDEMAG